MFLTSAPGTREKPPISFAVEALTWRFAIGLALIAGAISILCWKYISEVLSLPLYLGPLIAVGTVLNVTVVMSTARARLHERYRAIALATVASGIGSTAIAIVAAFLGPRNELPLILSALAISVISLLMLGLPPTAVLLKPSGLGWEDRKRILSVGGAIVVTAPAFWVMASSDRWFLGYFSDTATVGIYSVSAGVAVIGFTVNSAIALIWLPEASKLFEGKSGGGLEELGSVTEAIFAAQACVWLAVTAGGGDLVRVLTAKSFHDGTFVIPLIAAGVLLHGIASLSNTIYMLERRVHHTIFWWVGGAATTSVLCLLLVPRFEMLGAAASQLAGYFVAAIGLSMGARRLQSHINWMRLLIITSTILVAAFFMIPAWSENPILSMCFKAPVGFTVVIIVLSCFKMPSMVEMELGKGMVLKNFIGRFLL